jgi:hypothetical protein
MKRSHRAFAALAIISALAIAAPASAVPSFAKLAQATAVDTVGRLSDLARITVTGRRVPNPGGDQIEVRLPCPEGRTGKRVQAIYAFIAGQPSRSQMYASGIRDDMTAVDGRFDRSAQKTGGHRFVRWVKSSSCVNSVVVVSVSHAAADRDTPGNELLELLASELRSKGYADPNRKYLVWTDPGARTINCKGFGVWRPDDDRPGLDNSNNSGPSYAIVPLCTDNNTRFIAAHELMHTLGSVQLSAPNRVGGHCGDGYDVMCVRGEACSETRDSELFDCGNDDYFFAGKPPAGNYLATHWNTANSSFLINSNWPG